MDVHDRFKEKTRDSSHWLSTWADTAHVFAGGHSAGGVHLLIMLSRSVALLDRPEEFSGIVYFASYPSNNSLLPHDVSDYPGYVLSMAGEEDSSSTPDECETGYDKYTSAECKHYGLFSRTAHGAFGDYDNPDQPVGSISRDSATGTIRHYLVSFMETYAKNDAGAEKNLKDPASRPATTLQYKSNCSLSTGIERERGRKDRPFIHPQPVTGKSHLHIPVSSGAGEGSVTIRMVDITGKTLGLFDRTLKRGENRISLPFDRLNQGVYFIRIEGEKRGAVKFVIQGP